MLSAALVMLTLSERREASHHISEQNPLSATERPIIFDYTSLPAYVTDMLAWRREAEPGFSIGATIRDLPGCSKALVTRVANGSRRLTRDRVGPFAALLQLSRQEARYLDDWVAEGRLRAGATAAPQWQEPRRRPKNHLLNDWVNVYVKDALHLRGFKLDPQVIHRLLGGMVSPQRIARSINFLLREGFFRRTPDGKVALQDHDEVTTDGIPDKRVNDFHKKALDIAKRGLEIYTGQQRRSEAYVFALNEENLQKLKELLAACMDQVVQFRQDHAADDERLYQVVMHLTPVGGKLDAVD